MNVMIKVLILTVFMHVMKDIIGDETKVKIVWAQCANIPQKAGVPFHLHCITFPIQTTSLRIAEVFSEINQIDTKKNKCLLMNIE